MAAHGGKRPGAGRKPGSENRPALTLTAEEVTPGSKPTQAQRHRAQKRTVAFGVAKGWPREKIAAVLGLQLDQLEAAFQRELQHGKELLSLDEFLRLDAASAEGNVGASKAILAQLGESTGDNPPKKGKGPNGLNEAALRIINGGKRD